jgi:hypothetical protein
MEQEQDATRGSTGSNRGDCRRLRICTSSVGDFKTTATFRVEKTMEVMWHMGITSITSETRQQIQDPIASAAWVSTIGEAMISEAEIGEEMRHEAMLMLSVPKGDEAMIGGTPAGEVVNVAVHVSAATAGIETTAVIAAGLLVEAPRQIEGAGADRQSGVNSMSARKPR